MAREVSSSHDDLPLLATAPLPKELYTQLFPHQLKEVRWMSDSEERTELTLAVDMEYIPLLDSGYFFHASNRPIRLY